MDFPTSQAIKDVIGSLKGRLPQADYERIAPLLSELVALVQRAHEEERKQLKAERAALDKDREAVNLARRGIENERDALAKEREVVEREKKVAQRWREADQALGTAAGVVEPPLTPD
ncbi:MAG TPA: hypothetical protein VNE39_10810 [Planctomycetota bacterium]|nr:hypothetical protein [Planctomycetota bacterium]